jgi:protein TonB
LEIEGGSLATFLHHMSVVGLAGLACVLGVGLFGFVALVVLRFRRRGAARFWTAPAAIAVCLLPLAVGLGFSVVLLRAVLQGIALVGMPGVAATAAGSVEALLPTELGFGVLCGLLAFAFLATAAGSSRAPAPASRGLASWGLLAVSMIVAVLLGGLVWLFHATVTALNGPAFEPTAMPGPLRIVLIGAAALAVLAFVLAVAASLLAPRGPADLGMKLVSLAALGFCGMLALGGLWATWSRSQTLMRTAITGVRDGEPPEPVAMAEPEVEPTDVPRQPPPPPPPDRNTKPEFRRRTYREDLEPSTPRSEGGAFRVGGAIKEPKKIKDVRPVYPELAKQARVEGVVILEATISPRGDVTSVTVLRGIPLLDQSAIDAVREWVYAPTLLNGVPVPVIMTVTVNYRLK